MKPAIALCLISYTCGMLYVILTFFTGWLVYFDELWITLGFLIGLVLLILWRVKQRGKVWCTVSALLLVCSVLFGCTGIYNAYFRPKSAPIGMTEQESRNSVIICCGTITFKRNSCQRATLPLLCTSSPTTSSPTVKGIKTCTRKPTNMFPVLYPVL